MKNFLFNKIEAWVYYLTIVLGLAFTLIFGAFVRQELEGDIKFGIVSKTALFLAEIPSNMKWILTYGESDFLVTDRFPEKSGFISYKEFDEEYYLLLSRYDGDKQRSVVELIDFKDFQVKHSWLPDINNINSLVDTERPQFKHLLRDHNQRRYRMMHPLLLENGNLITQDMSPLISIDLCSNLVWQNDDVNYHHSIESDADGNIWAPGWAFPSRVKGAISDEPQDFLDDAIVKVSPQGEVLYQKSVNELFIDHGLGHLIFGSRSFIDDPMHLNDIQPVLEDGPHWKKGDVFLSLRHQSMIMLYRPSTDEVVWFKAGPYMQQHDVDIINDHQISIFNNNSGQYIQGHDIYGNNEVMIYDFRTDRISSPYKEFLQDLDVKTIGEGRSEILSNGNLFVEEQNSARTFVIDRQGDLVWEHINRADNGKVYIVSWSRMIKKSRFKFLSSPPSCY